MFQTVLMFLASPQNAARTEFQNDRPASRMATRAQGWHEGWHEGRHEGRNKGRGEAREENQVTWLAVVGNAFGFALLMTGLWLVVRLVETLLG